MFKKTNFNSRLQTLDGIVLELGFGDGRSLLDYHSDTNVIAVEKKKKWIENAEKMLARHGLENITLIHGSAENIPFREYEFDYVTSSFMLCSVDSQKTAISEIYRVLKPGGRYIAIEHTLSKNRLYRTLQKVLTRPVSKIADNCHLNSDPVSIIALQKFNIIKSVYFPYYLEPPLFIEAEKVI